jgi:hypothetical protein
LAARRRTVASKTTKSGCFTAATLSEWREMNAQIRRTAESPVARPRDAVLALQMPYPKPLQPFLLLRWVWAPLANQGKANQRSERFKFDSSIASKIMNGK